MIEPTMNQYAPPVAHVEDAPHGAVSELKLFSAEGRIGRLRYLAYSTGASIVYYIVLGVLAFTMLSGDTQAFTVASWAALAAVLWFNVITGIKRCHDMNISGWWSLSLVIPLIVLVWMFAPGTRGENRFGPPPPANTLGVKILGFLMPVVFIAMVGLLAAIAIPQYKAYVEKAKAAAQQQQHEQQR